MFTVGDLLDALSNVDGDKRVIFEGVDYLDDGEVDICDHAYGFWIEYGDYTGNDE